MVLRLPEQRLAQQQEQRSVRQPQEQRLAQLLRVQLSVEQLEQENHKLPEPARASVQRSATVQRIVTAYRISFNTSNNQSSKEYNQNQTLGLSPPAISSRLVPHRAQRRAERPRRSTQSVIR